MANQTTPTAEPNRPAETFYEEGRSFFAEKHFGEAITKFRKALELRPNFFVAWKGLAWSLYLQGEFAEAAEAFGRAAGIGPEDPDVYNGWGWAEYKMEQYSEAIEKFQKAIRIKPDHHDAYTGWGWAGYKMKQYSDAIEKFQKAIEIKPGHHDAYTGWGWVLSGMGRNSEAIEKFRKAVEIKPDQPYAHNGLGWSLGLLRRYPEAIEAFRKAVEIKADFAEAYSNWGWVLYQKRQFSEAIEKFARAVELTPDLSNAYLGWGWALYQGRQLPEAIEKFQRCSELKPVLVEAYNGWGWALMRQYRYEEAIKVLNKGIEIDKDFASGYHNIAFIAWKQGKYREGGDAWERAGRVYERLKPAVKSKNANFLYTYGNLLYQVFRDLKRAEEVLSEGLAFDPEHAGILAALVSVRLDQGEEGVREMPFAKAMARESFRKAARLLNEQLRDWEDPITLRELGELLLKMEDHVEAETEKYAEAEKWLQSSLLKDNEASTTYVDLGVLYSRRNDFRKAIQYFEDALRRDADDLNAWSNLAETYLKAHSYEKSEAEYRKILGITPDHVESHIGLGLVYTELGEAEHDEDFYHRALDHLERAIKLGTSPGGSFIPRASKVLKKKELAAVYYSTGYAKTKQYETSKTKPNVSLLVDAREAFAKCLRLDPDNHKAGRAVEKLDRRLKWFSPQWLTDKVGPWLILILLLGLFSVAQTCFLRKWPQDIKEAPYVTLTLSSLVFSVIALYLPQILKLKVAGIELEKSSVNQIATTDALGIGKPTSPN